MSALLACVAAVTARATALAPEPPREGTLRRAGSREQSQEVARAIADLAHPDAAVREKASRYLWLSGKIATEALTQAAASDDPEVAARARSILSDFTYGIFPDTPPEMRELIVAYRDGRANDKLAVTDALWQKGKPGYPVLARLWLAESNKLLKDQLFQQISRKAPEMASALIAEDALDTAEQLLLEAVRANNANDADEAPARALAAYYLLRGRDRQEVERLQQGRLQNPSQLRLLTHLYRARGDLDEAARLAGTYSSELRQQIQVERCDWPSLARQMNARVGNGASIEHTGLLAAYQRLAGDEAAARQTIARLYKPGAGPFLRTTALAILLNGRAREAVDVLRGAGDPLAAFQLLSAQQRYREAMRLADDPGPGDQMETVRLTASKAALLDHLGEPAQAGEIFDRLLEQGDRTGSPAGLAASLEAALRWDLTRHTVRFTAKLLARGRPSPDPTDVLARIFDQKGEEAAFWWSFVREEQPDEDPEAALDRVRRIVDKQVPAQEVLALAARARVASRTLPRHWRYKRLRLLAQTLLDYDADDEAARALRELVNETGGDADGYIQLGHIATRQQKWELATEFYSQAIQRDRSRSVPRYLRGHALVQLGDRKAGEALMEQAVLMPLADEVERYALAEALRRVELHDAEMRQYRLILATGPFRSTTVDRVLWRLLFNQAAADSDPKTAADLCDRAVVGFFDNLEQYEVPAYVGITHLSHKLRARALLADGKVEEAMARVEECFRILPVSSSVAIELVPELQRLGADDKADALVRRVVAAHETLIADHPRCASHHNSLAWTLARCRRELDKALHHARLGTELAPDNCAILDTLAEVYFQRGETEAAVATIKRCITLEPAVPRHRVALRRFQTSTPATPPPDE